MADTDGAPEVAQTFVSPRAPHEALTAAETYLEGAGVVAAPLRGRLKRSGDRLVVHYGRVRTHVAVESHAEGSTVHVGRRGRAPLEDTRRWLFGLGVLGFALAWGLAWYNSAVQDFLSPLVTIALFFIGIFLVVVGLYVVDRSLERRASSLLQSLEDAMRGDPLLVLQREIDALERSSSFVNGLLFYCVALVVEFIAFSITLGVGTTVDRAVALDVMPYSFGIPVIPALLFGVVWFFASRRLHGQRMALVERRFTQ